MPDGWITQSHQRRIGAVTASLIARCVQCPARGQAVQPPVPAGRSQADAADGPADPPARRDRPGLAPPLGPGPEGWTYPSLRLARAGAVLPQSEVTAGPADRQNEAAAGRLREDPTCARRLAGGALSMEHKGYMGVRRSWDHLLEPPSGRGLVAIPFVLIVTITVLDIYTGRDVQLGPLLVIAPALTASSPGHGSPLSPGSWPWRPRCSSPCSSAD